MIKNLLPGRFKQQLNKFLQSVILKNSLICALKEQHLKDLSEELSKIVPSIVDQYSTFKVDTAFLDMNVRSLHAFQISLLANIIKQFENPVIVDIGDSAGTHLKYIKGLYGDKKNMRFVGVNLDRAAVEKIRKNGLEAICARAEDLEKYNIGPDIFLCFETLEHLMDPFNFLYRLSSVATAKYLVITVPYLRKSRVGLHHIRQKSDSEICAENTHMLELSPEDWKLVMLHSGWEVIEDKIYLQYPRRHFLRITKALWKKIDFEGFYGVILKKNDKYSSRYKDWR